MHILIMMMIWRCVNAIAFRLKIEMIIKVTTSYGQHEQMKFVKPNPFPEFTIPFLQKLTPLICLLNSFLFLLPLLGLVQAKQISFGSSEPENSENLHWEIPCSRCQLPHGSCMAPPYELAPPNLRGCMMGRAAIDNPSIFWDADRYFYGMRNNPCQNRRQVLEQYASYLEDLYPKRCCDTNEEMTHQIPVPKINQLRLYCRSCRDKCRPEEKMQEEVDGQIALIEMNENKKTKIATRIIGRSFKPIRGLFHGLPGGKVFLHTLDKLGRDKTIRNCGPGYILRCVMEEIPSDLLDQNFILSEDVA